jgi:DNA-binding response OmpR family regulator
MTGNGDDRKWEVLVVDDEDDLRHLVGLTIGFHDSMVVVATASSAAEATEAAGRVRPDLIVLDHWLGGEVTGRDLASQLRTALPGTRVILFSATEDVIDLRDPFVDAVVPKSELARLTEIALMVLGSDPSA